MASTSWQLCLLNSSILDLKAMGGTLPLEIMMLQRNTAAMGSTLVLSEEEFYLAITLCRLSWYTHANYSIFLGVYFKISQELFYIHQKKDKFGNA